MQTLDNGNILIFAKLNHSMPASIIRRFGTNNHHSCKLKTFLQNVHYLLKVEAWLLSTYWFILSCMINAKCCLPDCTIVGFCWRSVFLVCMVTISMPCVHHLFQEGTACLHLAISSKYGVEVATQLITLGADINATNKVSWVDQLYDHLFCHCFLMVAREETHLHLRLLRIELFFIFLLALFGFCAALVATYVKNLIVTSRCSIAQHDIELNMFLTWWNGSYIHDLMLYIAWKER